MPHEIKHLDLPSLLSRVRTPAKAGKLLLTPSYTKGAFDSHAVDCPFPFRHDGRYWMTFIGWDGIGYQTGWAMSDDLVHWEKQGLLIGRGPTGSVTEFNVALTCILRDNELYGPGTLRKVAGRYVGTYHAYPKPGYESGSAVIGLCYSDDLMAWEMGEPILTPEPSCPWEAGGLYKSWLMEYDGIYYLFYNAKDKPQGRWLEQTGVATSRDLLHWDRHPANPILPVGGDSDFDGRFASDPVVLRHDGMWLLFYFGLSYDGHARDGVAYSPDLIHWTKSDAVLIDTGPDGSLDSRHAHKPGIITADGTLYHFYCAVRPSPDSERLGDITHSEARGIALATS